MVCSRGRETITTKARGIFFTFNGILVTGATALMSTGYINLLLEKNGIGQVTDISFGGFAIAVAVIAFLALLPGFYGGYYAGKKENSLLMLLIYAIILSGLVILQVVLGALAFTQIQNDAELSRVIHQTMEKLFDDYSSNPTADKMDLIDTIQLTWECCGVDGPGTWGGPAAAPASCYEYGNILADLNDTGCARIYELSMHYSIKSIAFLAIGYVFAELGGAIFALVLRNKYK